jgi:hypothetical protein
MTDNPRPWPLDLLARVEAHLELYLEQLPEADANELRHAWATGIPQLGGHYEGDAVWIDVGVTTFEEGVRPVFEVSLAQLGYTWNGETFEAITG